MDEAALLCTCVFNGEMALLRRLLRAGAHPNAGAQACQQRRCLLCMSCLLWCPFRCPSVLADTLALLLQGTMTAGGRCTLLRVGGEASKGWVCEEACRACAVRAPTVRPPAPAAEAHLPAVEALVSGGADPAVLDRQAWTAVGPLHSQGCTRLVTSPNPPQRPPCQRWGNTPADEARRVGAGAICAYLERAGGAA